MSKVYNYKVEIYLSVGPLDIDGMILEVNAVNEPDDPNLKEHLLQVIDQSKILDGAGWDIADIKLNRDRVKYICSTCGTIAHDSEQNLCRHGHDSWLERRDFNDPQLNSFVEQACSNLNMSRDELKAKFSF